MGINNRLMGWHIPQDKPTPVISHRIICEDVDGNFYEDYIDEYFDDFSGRIIRWGYIYEKSTDSNNTDVIKQLASIKNAFDSFRDEIDELNRSLIAVSGSSENKINKSDNENNQDASSRSRSGNSTELYSDNISGTNGEDSSKSKSISDKNESRNSPFDPRAEDWFEFRKKHWGKK